MHGSVLELRSLDADRPITAVRFLPSAGRYTCCCTPSHQGAAVLTVRLGGCPRSLEVLHKPRMRFEAHTRQ